MPNSPYTALCFHYIYWKPNSCLTCVSYYYFAAFDAGGKVSIGLTATTIVSQWTWSATLLQSSTVASKVRGGGIN